jgi:hypothetical protein
MHVVGHEAIRKELQAKELRLFGQQFEVQPAVIVRAKDIHRPHPALGEVVWMPWQHDPRYSGHGQERIRTPRDVQAKREL